MRVYFGKKAHGLRRAAASVVFSALVFAAGCGILPAAPTPSPTAAPPVTAPPDTHPSPTPEVSPTPDTTKTPHIDPTPQVIPGLDTSINNSSPAFLQATEDRGQEYINKIIFLGDSTTYGLEHYGMLEGGTGTKQVWTPASGTLTLAYHSSAFIVYPPDGSEITIVEAAARAKPEILVITLGVNGVSFMGEESFKSSYTALVRNIQAASPDTKIILQSIFPVDSNYQYLDDINNTRILDANRWILSVAEATGVKYLNTISVLLGPDGWMITEYGNGDGLHLGPAGFEKVLRYIRTHGLH